MDTENTRVTRAEAARLTGVSERTVSRWAAAGLLPSVRYGPFGHRVPATYDPAEVLAAPARWAEIVRLTVEGRVRARNLELPETDIST